MSAREKMKQWRENRKTDFYGISKICGVSAGLLRMVEEGAVTHPDIVLIIQKQYGLTDEEAEELLPRNRRPHDSEYEPDKFVENEELNNRINCDKRNRTVIQDYIAERYVEQRKHHSKRSVYNDC